MFYAQTPLCLHVLTFPFKCSSLPFFMPFICLSRCRYEASCQPHLCCLLLSTSRKDEYLALSTLVVSPKEGNRQMSLTSQQIRSGYFPGWGWHGKKTNHVRALVFHLSTLMVPHMVCNQINMDAQWEQETSWMINNPDYSTLRSPLINYSG